MVLLVLGAMISLTFSFEPMRRRSSRHKQHRPWVRMAFTVVQEA